MTKLERSCDSYIRITADYDHDAFDISRVRRTLQNHIEKLDPERRKRLAEADLRLLEIARAETDRADQVDLWDVLSYIGFVPEGPVTMA